VETLAVALGLHALYIFDGEYFPLFTTLLIIEAHFIASTRHVHLCHLYIHFIYKDTICRIPVKFD
ncbi:MAG: hypothetical protein ACRDIV_25595, partial [Ktedonobacteraceae bacterium]